MVVVAKPGKIRICLDPKVNKAIKCSKYQMPTLDETLPKLGKAIKCSQLLTPKMVSTKSNLTTTAAN